MQDATETTWETGLDAFETDESEFQPETGIRSEAPLDEVEEMEAAAALLEVSNEAGLDQFLGGLLRKATRKLGGVVPKSVLRAVGAHAKGAMKKALPGLAQSAAGALGLDPALATRAVDAAGQALGLELEGLSGEDQEFEVARRLVRFTSSAANHAARAARSGDIAGAARRGLRAAARRHAPGLLRSVTRASGSLRRQNPGSYRHHAGGSGTNPVVVRCHCGGSLPESGRWQRDGEDIVLDLS